MKKGGKKKTKTNRIDAPSPQYFDQKSFTNKLNFDKEILTSTSSISSLHENIFRVKR